MIIKKEIREELKYQTTKYKKSDGITVDLGYSNSKNFMEKVNYEINLNYQLLKSLKKSDSLYESIKERKYKIGLMIKKYEVKNKNSQGNAKELESKLNTLKVVYKHIEKLKSAHGYYQSMIYAMKEYIVEKDNRVDMYKQLMEVDGIIKKEPICVVDELDKNLVGEFNSTLPNENIKGLEYSEVNLLTNTYKELVDNLNEFLNNIQSFEENEIYDGVDFISDLDGTRKMIQKYNKLISKENAVSQGKKRNTESESKINAMKQAREDLQYRVVHTEDALKRYSIEAQYMFFVEKDFSSDSMSLVCAVAVFNSTNTILMEAMNINNLVPRLSTLTPLSPIKVF